MRSLTIHITMMTAVLAFSAGTARSQFYDIGLLPGGTESQVRSLSSDGSAAAGFCLVPSAGALAVRWTTGTGLTSLGSLGNGLSYGWGISGDGSVVCGQTNFQPLNVTRAFRWVGGVMTQIGTLPNGPNSGARAISADGQFIAGISDIETQDFIYRRAFRWTSAGMQHLGVLPGANESFAYAISGSGAHVAGYSTVAGQNRAFRWTSSGMQNLGVLPGGNSSIAWGISHDGSTVVGVANVPGFPLGGSRAFKWTSTGGMVDLGMVQDNTSAAYACNSDGSCVYGDKGVDANKRAFLHSEYFSTQVTDVTNFLTIRGLNPQNWIIRSVYAVSSDGTAIAGYGQTQQGQDRGFVVRNLPCLQGPNLLSTSGDQSACVGGIVTISVTGGGTNTGPIQYQWYRLGFPVSDGPTGFGSATSGATTGSLTFSNLTLADAGPYDVWISSPCGLRVHTLTVYVTPALTIDSQPVATSTCVDGTATFQVSVTSPSGNPTYQWQRHQYLSPPNVFVNLSDGPQWTGSIISGSNTPVLTITDATLFDSDRYRCVITDACSTEISDRPMLTVHTGPSIVTAVQLTSYGCSHGTVTLNTVAVPGSAGGGLTYQWNKDNVPLSDSTTPCGSTITGSNTNTLTISNTAGIDQGVYGCTVTGLCGTGVSAGQVIICVADVDDGSETGTCDGGVTFDDLTYYLYLFDNGYIAADIDDGSALGIPDCGVTLDDLIYFLTRFDIGC